MAQPLVAPPDEAGWQRHEEVLAELGKVRASLQDAWVGQMSALSLSVLSEFEQQVAVLLARHVAPGAPVEEQCLPPQTDLPWEPLANQFKAPTLPKCSKMLEEEEELTSNTIVAMSTANAAAEDTAGVCGISAVALANAGPGADSKLALKACGSGFTWSETTSVSRSQASEPPALITESHCVGKTGSCSSGLDRPSQKDMNGMSSASRSHTGFFASEDQGWRSKAFGFLTSWKYETVSSSLILLNCVSMGIQAHQGVLDPTAVDHSAIFVCDLAEHIFTALFTLECCAMYVVVGLAGFSPRTAQGRSHLTDAALVFFTGVLLVWIIPGALWLVGEQIDSSVLRILLLLRVMRLGRIVRVFQRLPLFREAWMLIRGLIDSVRTLFWTCVVIIFVTYVFSVVGLVLIVPLLQEHSDALADENPEARQRLDEAIHLVDGLDKIMYTLVQILMGDSFHTFMRVILEYVSWSWVYFYMYISLSSLVLLNLVTAIIVENARENSANDHADAIRAKEVEKTKTLRKLKRLFTTMDADASGSISWDEFRESFADPGMLQHWTLLDFGVEDCEEVWHLIDDGDGVIEIDEFVDALTRMQGAAQAKDIFRLQRLIQTLYCASERPGSSERPPGESTRIQKNWYRTVSPNGPPHADHASRTGSTEDWGSADYLRCDRCLV